MELKAIRLELPEDGNLILGQTHFIKTVEDVYEAIVNTVPQMKFGVAFNEASRPCLPPLGRMVGGGAVTGKGRALTEAEFVPAPAPLVADTTYQ